MKKYWVFLALAFLGNSSARETREFAGLSTSAISKEVLELNEWTAIGPFIGRAAQSLFEEDLLLKSGVAEGGLNESNLAKIVSVLAPKQGIDVPAPSAVLTYSRPQVFALNGRGNTFDFRFIFRGVYPRSDSGTNPEAVIYLCKKVMAPHPMKAYLVFGSGGGAKVWANSRLVYSSNAKKNLWLYDCACEIDLNEGENLLLVKVWTAGGGWGLGSVLAPDASSAVKQALSAHVANEDYILRASFFNPDEEMVIAPTGVARGVVVKCEIAPAAGASIAFEIPSNSPWVNQAKLTNGFYRITVREGEASATESFYVGDPLALGESLCALARSSEPSLDVDAQIRRYKILAEPGNRPKQKSRTWERKMLWTLKELSTLLSGSAARKVPEAGMHAHGFKSKIDDQIQFYRISIPERLAGSTEPMPVAVMIPTSISAVRPFIESVFMAAHSEAEEIAAIAGRLGICVVWLGYRHAPDGNPSEFTHFDEVMEDVARRYRIDLSRIGLFGACSAGATSCLMSAKWPTRFSAVGLLNPMFGLDYAGSNRAENLRNSDYVIWSEINNPVLAFKQLDAPPPMLIISDGGEVGHGELSNSLTFMRIAQSKHTKIALEITPQDRMHHNGAWDRILSWMITQKRRDESSEISQRLSGGRVGLGSISQAIAERFVVIRGTGGLPDEQEVIDKWFSLFNENWKKAHFGNCLSVDDLSFIEEDYKDCNLVLIGNSATNRVWGKLQAGFPFKLEKDHVVIDDRTFKGRALAVKAVFNDSKKAGRKIVFIGGHDLRGAQFGAVNLPLEGWFEAGVWEDGKLVFAGNRHPVK